MADQASRGSLIIFEGCDRSGKTTQVTKLVNKLNSEGKLTKMIKFPVRSTNIGKVIDSYLTCDKELDDHTVHLLFSANRWEMKQEIITNLEMGVNVIIDRYAHSGVAYSAAKPGFDISWCKNSDQGLPKPDMVCFLNVFIYFIYFNSI